MATSLKDAGAINVTPLHPAIGAEIGGVDLSKALSADAVDAIRRAWHDHIVLLFRGQDISGQDQLRFAGHFSKRTCHGFIEVANRIDPPFRR